MNDGAAMTDGTAWQALPDGHAHGTRCRRLCDGTALRAAPAGHVSEQRRRRLADLAAKSRAEVEEQAERRAATLAERIAEADHGPAMSADEVIEALPGAKRTP